jgi:hypothetical protein
MAGVNLDNDPPFNTVKTGQFNLKDTIMIVPAGLPEAAAAVSQMQPMYISPMIAFPCLPKINRYYSIIETIPHTFTSHQRHHFGN